METVQVGIFTRIFRDEDTIYRAIDSILNQTHRNLRFYIIVNDITREKVEKYTQKEERVKVFHGVAMAEASFNRMAGKMILDGNDYIASLDADDWYERDWLETMLEFMRENRLDVAACGSRFVDVNGRLLGERRLYRDISIDMEQFPQYFSQLYMFCRPIWAKLYAKPVIEKYDFRKIPNPKEYGGYGGDTIVVLEALKGAERFGVLDKMLHNYQVSKKSSTYSHFAEGRLNSDVLLFRKAEGFLKHYGAVSRENEVFLCAVYSYAVIDTILIVHNHMGKKEQIGVYHDIFTHEITQRVLELCRKGELSGKKGEWIKKITELILSFFAEERKAGTPLWVELYDKVFAVLFPECRKEDFELLLLKKEFMDCYVGGEWQQLTKIMLEDLHTLGEGEAVNGIRFLHKLQRDALMEYLLLDTGFVMHYRKLAAMIAGGEGKGAMELCYGILSGGQEVYQEGKLIEVLLNLAAVYGDMEYFLLGKRRKLVYLLRQKDEKRAEEEYNDLMEMGVAKEEVDRWLQKVRL